MSYIYDCTRHYWANVKIEKAELADYVFGVAHCKVVGVFKPHRWYYTEPGNRKTRIQFEGEEIMDSPYLGMDLSDYFKGVQNPVRYIGNWGKHRYTCTVPWHKLAISLPIRNYTMSSEPLKPTSLPSIMNRFAYPMKALEISVLCFEEEYATKQASLIQEEISLRLDQAIRNGWSYSNSMYQNLRVDGRRLTFDFYQSFSSLIHVGGSFCVVPLTYHNQYEKPNIESVTFRYVLDEAEAGYIYIFDNTFRKALEDAVIDSYIIEGLTITATSSGSNPFKRLLDTYMRSVHLIDELKRTKHQAAESDKSLKSSINSIMITIAIIIMLSLLIRFIVV